MLAELALVEQLVVVMGPVLEVEEAVLELGVEKSVLVEQVEQIVVQRVM